MTHTKVMAMAQVLRQPREDGEGVQADALKFISRTTPRSHILVQQAAVERNDSGRMVICDDIDIPDVMDFTEWRGR